MTQTLSAATEKPGLAARLGAPVSIQSLAMFRICFGALLVWDVLRFVYHDRIRRYYAEPEFFFTYAGFAWVKPLPEPYIHYAWALVGVFAFMVTIGFLYRFAIIGFTLLFTYFFLLDKAQYLNHFYMVILFAALLCIMPANRAFSVDAWLRPSLRSLAAPYWAVAALRLQMEIILIFAGLVKITEDWFKLEPLGIWLRDQVDSLPLGAVITQDWALAIAAYGTIALHIFGAPLLLFKRTRMPAFLTYCAFHIANAALFNIGIFPWLTIAATLIFFEPHWPQQAARWLAGRFEALPPMQPLPVARAMPASRFLMAALALWMAVQISLPLRFALFPTEVRWAGDGHRFAWRMRMYERDGRGHFEVADPVSGQRWRVEPDDYLTSRQAGGMLTRPDMVLQFAHHLKALWAAKGFESAQVYAFVEMSLNGREYQPLINSTVDLAGRQLNLFGPDDWVTKLEKPFVAWPERQRADYDGPKT